jgi:hypothetical protein
MRNHAAGLRRWIAALALCGGLAGAAAAQFAGPGVVDAVLLEASPGEMLRARLLAVADSLAPLSGAEAARAMALRGSSYAREGGPDSAVASLERALALDDRADTRVRLAEALVGRLGEGDARRAAGVLRPIQPILATHPERGDAQAQALLAWTHYLEGRPDSAAALFAPLEDWLSLDPEWRYRLACTAMERREWTRALALLPLLAVRSRFHDSDVMEMLRAAAYEMNAVRRLQPSLVRELARADAADTTVLAGMGGRRIAFAADDGFPLGGVVFAPAARARRRAAVIVAAGDTLAAYDSLAIGLRRAGLSVVVLEPRGSGRSVGPSCPSRETWRGREAEMQLRVAGDVRAAVAALARRTGADTAAYLLVGMGAMAPAAVDAAVLDRRARALLLVSPAPDPVDRGRMRAAIAAVRRPVYFQIGPEDQIATSVLDALYRAGDPRLSRIADSDQAGRGAEIFRRDPRIMTRFRQWLEESWPRATPPTRPRAR